MAGIKIEVRNNNVEQALRVLKRKYLKDNFLKTYKEKMYYEKPSAKKRRKKKEMIANSKKAKKIRERNL
jgi:small subunit ribosomal protein S21|tara:strand:- start:1142 stop:1348 length:207 start_codon:yes stop_codon:yes gene_type:complete